MSLDVGLSSWRSRGRSMFGSMAASKGGGGGPGPNLGSGKLSRRRLDRTNASKGIDYDLSGSNRRRRAHSEEEDDSDYSTSREDWTDEFSVHGKEDVAEMNVMLRYLGLPGPANLGIDNEAYEMVKRTPSGSPTNDGFTFRQDSGAGSFRALSPGGDRASTSPHQPVVGPFSRPHKDVSPQPRSLQTSPTSQAGVENGTPTSAGATRINGGARSERAPIGFANVVRQAMEQQSRIEQEAAGVSNFITTHSVEDLPRHDSLPVPLLDRQHPALASVTSRSAAAPSAALQIERSQSDPLSNALRPGETAVSIGENNPGSAMRRQNEDKSQTRVVQNNLDDHDRAGLDSVVAEASGAKLSVPSGSSSVSPRHPQVPRPGANRSLLEKKAPLERTGSEGSKSSPMVLKPPPRMSIPVISLLQDQISTNEMLGSLAPDAAENAARSCFSDDEGNLSDSYDEQETSDVSEVSGVQPEQPSHASNGELIAGSDFSFDAERNRNVSGSEQPNDSSNGNAKEEARKPERRLTVDVPHVVIEPDNRTPEVPVGPKHPWTKGEQLGAGSFGTVYAALDSEGVFFAVKEVSMVENDKQAQQSISQLMSEIELLSRFKHDNIVQYLGTEKAHGKLYIFLELVSRGSLAAICRSLNLSHSQISAYTRQILKGLKYLHDRNIVHRDIKCANILVDTKGICKLADFGMAKQLDSLDQMKSCKGSAYWMAPEVIDPKKVSGLPADIWSLGCSILEMATGSPPFGEMEWYRVLWTVGHGNAPPIPETLSENAKDFVMRCLDINPMKRPTATELLLHPFVRQDTVSTPPSDPGVTFPPGPKTLDTIREEMSAELSGAPRAQDSNSLSNGH